MNSWFLRNAWRTDERTDGRTDRQTNPLIDLLFAIKNTHKHHQILSLAAARVTFVYEKMSIRSSSGETRRDGASNFYRLCQIVQEKVESCGWYLWVAFFTLLSKIDTSYSRAILVFRLFLIEVYVRFPRFFFLVK